MSNDLCQMLYKGSQNRNLKGEKSIVINGLPREKKKLKMLIFFKTLCEWLGYKEN